VLGITQTLETLVVRCPTEITPFLTQITARAAALLKYDPVGSIGTGTRPPSLTLILPTGIRTMLLMTTTMMMMMTTWRRKTTTSSMMTLMKSRLATSHTRVSCNALIMITF